MISFHILLFLLQLANGNPFWHIMFSCPEDTTTIASDFICTELLSFCYGNKTFLKSDYSLECFLRNTSQIIKLSVYKMHVELSTNNLLVLSSPVLVKLAVPLPADILALISKLRLPASISVQRSDVGQKLNNSSNSASSLREQVSSKLRTLLADGVQLPCGLFDRPANFTICIKSDENKAVHIQHELVACTFLLVHPWKDYAIQMRTDRLFPCEGIGISVSTKTPNCSSDVVSHQLRLLAIQSRQHSPIEVNRHGVYIGEQRLRAGVSVVNFHCNYFDLIYPEYCFQMVSVHHDGFVQQHVQRCVSTELKMSGPIHGRWSAWKDWSSCSSGCNAVRHRFRFCDDPAPRFGGRFCEGVGMETVRCNISCRDAMKSEQSVRESGICKCGGCTLSAAGAIVTFSAMCVNSSYWYVISPNNDTLIHWRMQSTCLAMSNERLKIRDGIGPLSPLLFDSNGHAFTKVDVITSGPSSTLELEIVPGENSFEKKNEIVAKEVGTDLLNVCVFQYSFVRADQMRNYWVSEKWTSLKEILHLGVTVSVSGVTLIGLFLLIFLCMRKRIGKLVAEAKTMENIMDTSICKVALLPSAHCGSERVRKSDCVPPEMINSTRTQTTQVSIDDMKEREEPNVNWNRMAVGFPNERLPLRRSPVTQRDYGEKSLPSSVKRTDSISQVSFIENEQEFEYDYYDAPVIGSILNPLQPWELIDNDFDFSTE